MAMLRLTSSTVVSNALRAISAPRILSGSITNVFTGSHQVTLPLHQQFSTDAEKPIDDKLSKILKSEIKYLKQSSLRSTIPATPANFPFTIEYCSCCERVTLKRELNGEMIVAEVTLPEDYADDESDVIISDSSSDESSSTDSDAEKESDVDEEENYCESCDCTEPHVHMTVKISKENGKVLELGVSAAAAPPEIIVNGISVMESAAESNQKSMTFGSYFVNMESDLQFALREYLEVRGFDKSIGGFLYKYMLCKSKQETVGLLKRVKKFVKE